jgi:hypothetical protein
MATSEADVRHLLTSGEIHVIEETAGAALICGNSVSEISPEHDHEL